MAEISEIRLLDHFPRRKLFRIFRDFLAVVKAVSYAYVIFTVINRRVAFDPVTVDIQKYWGGTCSQRADSYVLGVRTSVRNCSDLSRGFGILETRV